MRLVSVHTLRLLEIQAFSWTQILAQIFCIFHLLTFDCCISPYLVSAPPDHSKDLRLKRWWNVKMPKRWSVATRRRFEIRIHRPQTSASNIGLPQTSASNIGLEQEFFLVPRDQYYRRPNLQMAGRTIYPSKTFKRYQKTRIMKFGIVAILVATLFVAMMMTLENTITALALVASMRTTMTRYYHHWVVLETTIPVHTNDLLPARTSRDNNNNNIKS